MSNPYISPFAKPVYVMLKPVGSVCNLACEYCYYLEKGKLYPEVKNHIMSEQLLEKFIKEYLECQTMPQVLFTWHGGETLMRPISFYRKALELQRKYGHRRQIDNCIQTNGTLLNDDWCRFFKENNFLVGVSIDGPQEFHDEYRRNKQGLPSFYKVMKGIELLTSPEQQDANIKLAPFTVDAGKWGDFLCAVFDEWLKEDVGNYYIQLFDSTLANWVGEQPGVCTLARTCGHAGVMEFNGDVYACDHFVFPEYKLGNIHTQTLTEMMYSQRQLKFGADKYETLPTQCKECDYLFACNGECPKNRFLHTANGEPGLNYLCRGYKKFFKHVAPYMDFMKKELLAERPPANVMQWAKENKL